MKVDDKGIDLVCERVGGAVLWANDEFFAPKENLLRAAEPVWKEGEYTDRGKWMDGWETRRRRTPGHDHCIIRVGLPGIPRSVIVDTRFFRGNYPASCSIEACECDGNPSVETLQSDDVVWTEILPESELVGDFENVFALHCESRYTHLRLHIYPDGGVARLRLFGEVVMDPAVVRRGGQVDLAATEHGGRPVAWSDAFYGDPKNLLMPGRGVNMGDGWETKRRRGPGYDWVMLSLASAGVVQRIEIDTHHFKGNFPESFSLEGSLLDTEPEDWNAVSFVPLVARATLQAHTRHHFEVEWADPVSHVKLSIFPDGGVSRLRIWGEIGDETKSYLQVRHLNSLSKERAAQAFLGCCGSTRWAERMANTRPFQSLDEVLNAAEAIWSDLDPADWLEAFSAHPKIGERKAESHTTQQAARWSTEEQAAAASTDEALVDAVAEKNRQYADRFGFIFIVYASGRTLQEVDELLAQRLGHDPDVEIRIAADEQRKITANRLEKWLR